jgi:hypothetical protein
VGMGGRRGECRRRPPVAHAGAEIKAMGYVQDILLTGPETGRWSCRSWPTPPFSYGTRTSCMSAGGRLGSRVPFGNACRESGIGMQGLANAE